MERSAAQAFEVLRDFASGADRSVAAQDILFFALHIMAEKRETEAVAPLTDITLDGEALDDILGDAVTETLPQIFISLFDGDIERLKMLIENEGGQRMGAIGGDAGLRLFRRARKDAGPG